MKQKMPGSDQKAFNNKTRIYFYLWLAIITNLIVLLSILVLSPLAEDLIQTKPIKQHQEILLGLSRKTSQQKQKIYRQQEGLLNQLSWLKAQKPTPHLISLVKQLIQQEADIQDFVHANQQATYNMAKLVGAQEWSYSKTKSLRNYINSSRQRQVVLRKILKDLNANQRRQNREIQQHLKMNKKTADDANDQTLDNQ